MPNFPDTLDLETRLIKAQRTYYAKFGHYEQVFEQKEGEIEFIQNLYGYGVDISLGWFDGTDYWQKCISLGTEATTRSFDWTKKLRMCQIPHPDGGSN